MTILHLLSCLLSISPAAPQPVQQSLAGPASISGTGRTYRIPYRLTDTKHILVRARVNGKGPFNFVLDTGAPDLFLAAERAGQAGCTVDKEHYAAIRSFEIEGGPTLTGMKSRVEDLFQLRSMNAMDAAGARIDGVIGYTVLAQFRLEIDLSRDDMRWTRLNYRPPRPPALAELTGGKVPAAAQDAKTMEQMAKWATTMFQRKPAPRPVGRGVLGIEIASGDGPPTVARLFPGGAAERAGIRPGDKIVGVEVPPRDDTEIESLPALTKAIADLHAGDTVTLSVDRAGSRKRIAVKAAGGTL